MGSSFSRKITLVAMWTVNKSGERLVSGYLESQSGLVAILQMIDLESLGYDGARAGTEIQSMGFDQLEVAQILSLSLTCSVTSVWREVEGQEAAGDKEALCSPLVYSSPRNEILCVSLIKAGACILRLLKQSQLLARTEGVVLP